MKQKRWYTVNVMYVEKNGWWLIYSSLKVSIVERVLLQNDEERVLQCEHSCKMLILGIGLMLQQLNQPEPNSS